jgi:LacI family transcriptional regulator, galactose operon repressor
VTVTVSKAKPRSSEHRKAYRPKLRVYRPTLRDVAALARVDPSVVSRVVNDDPRLSISPETRTRVLAAIDKLGYRPNVMARGLRLARTWTIGFVLPDLGNPVYGQIVHGAQARAQENGYAIVLGSPLQGTTIDPAFTRLLNERRFDGLLVASATVEDERLRELADGLAPVVVVNRRVEGVESSVVVDDAAGGALATEHLLALGHTRVAHLGGPVDVDTSVRRREGFEAAVARAGIHEAVVCAGGGYDAGAGFSAACRLLERHPDVTGIFAANVMIAIGAISAARERGLRVPDDLSLVALHDFPLAGFAEPPLTTVVMPLHELGVAAAELLLARIEGRSAESRILTIPPRLIVRRSTAPPST